MSPFVFHCLDVEAKCGGYLSDVVSDKLLKNGRLSGIIQTTELESRMVTGGRKEEGKSEERKGDVPGRGG